MPRGRSSPAGTRRRRCSPDCSRQGAPGLGRSQGRLTRCWMPPRCRTTSTSILWIGRHTMSSLLDWAIVYTYGMHAAARSPSYAIWEWTTMFVLWAGRSAACT
uniref:WD-repeat protein, putative n=1 Tax=Arundo donax TaxID=35708 RepID=A0A0A9CWZ1_ARUDO